MGKSHMKPSWRNAALAALITLLIGGAVYAQTSATATSESDTSCPDLSNLQENVKGKLNWVKDLRRELKDIQRETKADTSAVGKFVDQYEACANVLQGLINCDSTPYWDKNRDCDDISEDMNDQLEPLRALRSLQYVKDNIKNRRTDIKNVDRQIKDARKDAPSCDLSAVEAARAKIEPLLAQIEQIIAANNPETVQDAQDLERDLTEVFQEAYDGLNVCQEQANVTRSKKDLERSVKDKERQLKDLNRELKQVSKQAPAGDEVLVKLQNILTNYQTILESFRQCVSNLGSGGDPQDCWDLNSELDQLCCAPEEGFWDIKNQIQQKGDLARCQKEREREHKQNLRQVKDLRKEENRLVKQLSQEAVSAITQCINIYEEALNKAGALIPTDQCHDYWNELQLDPVGDGDYAQSPPGGCWDLINRFQRVGDIKRTAKELAHQVKENDRECKRIEKEAKRMGSDASEVLGLCEEFRTLVASFDAALSSGDNEKALEIQDDQLNGPDGFWNRWGEALRVFWESGRIFGSCEEVSNISGEIDEGRQRLNALRDAGKIDGDLYKDCLGFINRGEELIGNVKNACSSGDAGSIEKEMQELEYLGEKAQYRCAVLFDEEPEELDYHEYEGRFEEVREEDLQKFGERFNENFRNDVFENVVAQFQEQIMKQVMEKILGTLEESLKARMTVMLENLAVTGGGGAVSTEEIVQSKLNALDCASSMKELSGRKGGEKLRAIISQVERATLGSETGKQLQSLCESFVSRAKDLKGQELADASGDLAGSIDQILVSAGEEAVQQGITCFADIPVDEWYHKEVCGAAQFGLLEKGEPTRNVNTAEVVKIVSSIVGASIDSAGSGEQWFAPYCRWAKEKGLTIACGGREATRAEVVRAVLEAAGVEPKGVKDTGFSDVSPKHPHAAYIAEAANRRIVSGTVKGGKKVFLPDRNILRAEAAAIFRKAFLAFGPQESDVFQDVGDEEHGSGFEDEDDEFDDEDDDEEFDDEEEEEDDEDFEDEGDFR